MSLRKILVAVDFEAPSLAALDWAIDLAAEVGAQVIILHAYEIPVIGVPDGAFIATAELAAKVMTAAQDGLAALVDSRQGRGVELVSMLRQGAIWETIRDVADEIDANLVAVGTHGRRGLSHMLLGSIAEKTIRTARRPVVVVRAPG